MMNRLLRGVGIGTALCISFSVLTGCAQRMDSDFITAYITETMNMYYYGETTEYLKLTNSDEETADQMHENAVKYFTSCLAYHCGVNSHNLREELYMAYYKFSDEYLKHAKYRVQDIAYGKNACYVTIEVEPLDYKTPMAEDISLYQHIYASRMRNLTGEARADFAPKFDHYYAKDVLRLLQEHLSTPVYHAAIQYEVEVILDAEGVYHLAREEDWLAMDRLVMGTEESPFYKDQEHSIECRTQDMESEWRGI